MTEARQLYENVIKNNYCIGCGACATIDKSPFKIQKDKFGNIIATANVEDLDVSDAKVLKVCPFSGVNNNENEIGALFFPKNQVKNDQIGRYLECYAGFVKDDTIRSIASSGGIGKWLSYKLLSDNHVDFYIQVTSNNSGKANDELFYYSVFSDPDKAIDGSTSAYYPTSLDKVLEQIKNVPGRYAITGVPCFIKAVRLLSIADPVIKERVKFTVGIVCGGMKSANQAKMISWQLGLHPRHLKRIDFRGKDYGVTAATTKIYRVWSDQDEIVREKNSGEIFGADYGLGFFKPNACDYCDDVVGETADISIGDVWLPEYRFDKKGFSLIIIRNAELHRILKDSFTNDEIHLESISPEDAIKSQQGGFRHRRDGLAYRLALKEKKNEWIPTKRVKAGQINIGKKREKIYALREQITKKSHEAFVETLDKNELSHFYNLMKSPLRKYKILNHGYWPKRLYVRIVRKIKRLLK